MSEAAASSLGQECVAAGTTSQGVSIRGSVLRLSRQVVVFELCGQTAVLMRSEAIADFTLITTGQTLFQGRAVVRTVISTGLVEVCEAELGEGWIDVNVAQLDQTGGIRIQFQRYLQNWQKQYQIRPEFKLQVGDLQMFLSELRHWTEQVELVVRGAPTGDRTEMERQLSCEISSLTIPYLDSLFDTYEQIFESLDEDARPAHRGYARRQLHPWVLVAPFASRTFSKPLGYAGDYEMVSMMWRNGQEGSSLYAKVLNSWFLNQAPAVAHRNRLIYLVDQLKAETVRASQKSKPVRVLSLGCGPAAEVELFLAQEAISDHVEFMLLDFNDETLRHVSATLEAARKKHHRQASIKVVRRSVTQILKEKGRTVTRTPSEIYDFVYCAGLFDYLEDGVCRKLVEILGGWVGPGGLLLLTNVDLHNPRRHTMDSLLDWPLLYRTAADIPRFFAGGVVPENVTVRADTSGVNLFIEVRDPKHG